MVCPNCADNFSENLTNNIFVHVQLMSGAKIKVMLRTVSAVIISFATKYRPTF